MAYIIFTEKAEMEKHQAECDVKLGFPEPLENFRHVGGGIHCPLEFGRAIHYAEAVPDKAAAQWALPKVDKVPEKATEVAELPVVDWPKSDPFGEVPNEEPLEG